jgi:hypothetical protein
MRRALAFLCLAVVLDVNGECIGERSLVKAAADPDAASIGAAVIPTTIAFLRSLPAPRPLPQESRVAPVEKTMYALTATLTEYRIDENGNAQLVLSDAAGRKMTAQIPSAACATGSLFAAEIETARRVFEIRLRPTMVWQSTLRAVEIRGVAFFNFLRGQRGIAPNGLEIHPVTFLSFSPLVTPQPPKRPPRRRAVGPHLPTCSIPSLALTTNKTSACAREPVTLTWQASDSSARVTIDGVGGSLPASGSTVVESAFSSAYSARAATACGTGNEAVVVVTLRPGASATLSAPAAMQRGGHANVSIFLTNTSSWSLSSTLRNTLSPSSGSGSGGFTSGYTASSAGNDTVTLSATGTCGPVTRSISIFIGEPPNQGLLCCDGTRSPTCFSCSSKQGCCSSHKGVCGCP